MQIEFIQSFFIAHLLLPLLALLVGIPLVLLQQKMPYIKLKEVLIYVLVNAIVLALPGVLGFSGNRFNPYWYLLGSFFYLLMGCLHVGQVRKRFRGQEVPQGYTQGFEVMLTLINVLLGICLFRYIFDWFSPFIGYATLASTASLVYVVPLLFYYTYIQFLQIPFRIYKTWSYEIYREQLDFDGVDLNQLKVVTIELTKKVNDGHQFRIKAKTLNSGVTFGDWFQKVLEDYNFKNATSTIALQNEDGTYYHWIFYSKRSLFHFRRYLDFDIDMAENKVRENDIICCRRVVENKQK
ncbi:TssN family type VI secretion system protein [Myroides sp. DW712]|uniref:TssN family type VI secretion system protein n=1 Tax=Myroides sp. DW712 TaxID=3389800 RepID=UPI0039782C20